MYFPDEALNGVTFNRGPSATVASDIRTAIAGYRDTSRDEFAQEGPRSQASAAIMSANFIVWTIGHSTRPLDQFLGLLEEHRIQTLADVRSHPGSRHCPQFGQAALSVSLLGQGLDYRWIPALGGRRKVRVDSVNTAWRNASFRGYADYMQTVDFAMGLDELLGLASDRRTAMMCAEAVWWRCHRSMVADALKARGVRVVHIMGPDTVIEHPWTAPARIVDGVLTYVSND